MLCKEIGVLFINIQFLLRLASSLTVYNNAIFVPNDGRFAIYTSPSINSIDSCFTVVYFNDNETCQHYIAQLNQGQLRVVPCIYNSSVYSFGNRNGRGKFKLINDIFPILS